MSELNITGKLYLHSETGTEGGHWAIQDEKFITPAPEEPVDKNCRRCHRYWGNAVNTPEPPPSFTYYKSESVGEDGTKYSGGYHSSDVPIEGGQTTFGNEPEGSFNDVYTKRSNAAALGCYEAGHDWKWMVPAESWSYEGLNYLENGDKLTLEDGTEIIVDMWRQPDQYAEDAVNAHGMVIHQVPTDECYDFDEWCKLFFTGTVTRLERSATI